MCISVYLYDWDFSDLCLPRMRSQNTWACAEVQSGTLCLDLTIYCTNGNSVVLGTDGSMLWMFPGLAMQHAKIKQGTHAKTFVQDEYHVGLSAKRWRLGWWRQVATINEPYMNNMFTFILIIRLFVLIILFHLDKTKVILFYLGVVLISFQQHTTPYQSFF